MYPSSVRHALGPVILLATFCPHAAAAQGAESSDRPWDGLRYSQESLAETTVTGASPTLVGTLFGAGSGLAAGLLFAHESCDEDPCSDGAYVLGAAGGAALLGAMGALIGAQTRAPRLVRRGVWTGTGIGAGVGVLAGVVLVAASCQDESCGAAGYTSVAMLGAGVFGALGAVIGSRVGQERVALPLLAPTGSRVLVGAQIRP